MKTFSRGDRLQVKVDRLSIGGRGVARHQGLVIFIPDTAPDETVEAELTLVKKNFAEARLVRVITPSPARITPPCPVAGICGGCSWQHVAYPEQLRQKQALVQEALTKFSGFDTQVTETVPSPKSFRYRNRIQLHWSMTAAGPKTGFHRRGSHEIVDIDDCPITEEALMRELPALKKTLAHRKAGRIELYLTTDGQAATRTSGSSSEEEDGATGPAFSQVNTGQNENLIRHVVELAKNALAGEAEPRVFDLYSGSGNFTFPLARELPNARVRAAELNRESVARAQDIVAREWSGRDLRFQQADVGAYITESQEDWSNAFVLLDPPRTGSGVDVMKRLAEKKPRWILYISCHPVTLARDLKPLQEAGYELREVRPFDMFPQTDHIETAAWLVRN